MGNKHQKLPFFEKFKKRPSQNSISTQTDQETQKENMLQEVGVEAQRQSITMNTHMMRIEEALKKKQAQAEKQETKVKGLIAQGCKTEAKRQVLYLKQLNSELALIHTRKMVLLKQKNQIDLVGIDTGMAGVIGKANEFMKQTDQVNQKITDALLDQREIQANRKQIDNLFQDMNEDSKEAQENLFNELEKEVNENKPSKILNTVLPQRLSLFEVPIKQPSQVIQNTVITKARQIIAQKLKV